ncbi:MAG: hypothetical protein SFT92_00805 [Rickettsiales bacterium]|nr:hypothetical protein [Rickettsiales bacterium]
MVDKPSPPLTPEAREAKKTDAQRAQDTAYTINHAIACTVTDFIDPYIGNVTQTYLGKRFSIGCNHDHSHDANHDYDHAHDHTHDHPHDHSHLTHWWIGEVVGDFGAVPLTIGLQRYAPGFMDRLRMLMEPALGTFFHKGAERTAKKWALKHGVPIESDEYKAQLEAIYRHEMDHLPQALIWTASSIAINLATQRAMGNHGPFWQLAAGKATGATISAGLVVSGRGLAPGAAESWDNFTSEHLFLPATQAVGGLFGVKKEDVQQMAERQKQLTERPWSERAQSTEPTRGK